MNDFAVTPNRSIESLQIAIHNEYEVIELFAGSKTDRTQRLRLIHFTVSAKHPNLPVTGVCQSAGVEIFEESGLVDRHQRPEAHRNRRKLPELRHQLRMRITRQTDTVHFLAKMIELCLTQAALQIRSTIEPWCSMSLEINQITAMTVVGRMPEVVHTSTDHRCERRERCDVTTQIAAIGWVMLVRTYHHRHRIPANEGADALLELHVARARHFEVSWDGIDVGRMGRKWNVRTRSTGLLNQLLQERVCTLRALALNNPLERIQPLLGFLRVWIMG